MVHDKTPGAPAEIASRAREGAVFLSNRLLTGAEG